MRAGTGTGDVAPELEGRVLDTLQRRWATALADLAAPNWAAAVASTPALPAAADDRPELPA